MKILIEMGLSLVLSWRAETQARWDMVPDFIKANNTSEEMFTQIGGSLFHSHGSSGGDLNNLLIVVGCIVGALALIAGYLLMKNRQQGNGTGNPVSLSGQSLLVSHIDPPPNQSVNYPSVNQRPPYERT